MKVMLVAAWIAAATLFASGAAQAAAALDGYKPDVIQAIFTGLGATEMKSELMQGDPRLSFKIETTTYVIDFYRCEDTAKGCMLLQYACVYDPEASDTVEAVNQYNAEYVFGKAALDKKEGLMSLRAVIWGPGSSKELVVAEFGAFVGATGALLDHMKKTTAVSNTQRTTVFMNTSLGRVETSTPISAKLKGAPKNRR